MKSHVFILFFVGLASASTSPAWKSNTEYVYLVNGRTLTSLHDLSDHYTGVFLKAKLYISLRPDGKLQARVDEAQYAQIHSRLPDSWYTNVPDSLLSYKEIGLSKKPFLIFLENGVIKNLTVEREVTIWESNIIKSIISQFQLDVQGKQAICSPFNILPKNDKMEGVFKTMEETITGETETSYEIHPLPQYVIQSEYWLVPKPDLVEDGSIIEVIKNKNYTNSKERPAYHYGFGELVKGEPASNKMGEFFLRQSNSRVILTGQLSKFTIQHSETFNKIIINPTINSKDQGSVVSVLNVTLYEMKQLSDTDLTNPPYCHLVNPVEIGNLVYTYSNPFAESNGVHPKQEERGFVEDSYGVSAEKDMLYQSRPMMSLAPESPLLPYYVGYKGKSIKTYKDFDLKKKVNTIVNDIGADLPQPEQILLKSTLSKYTLLCSLVRLMNDEEITSVTEGLYTKCESGPERVSWEVFRDAVAEAGTAPAFLSVQKWIESENITKEEASEVVASMANAVRVPTKEYMQKFFELVNNPKVINQEYLNETALLSFTRLVNRVYVNKRESNNQYPIYSFKKFYSTEGKDFVKSLVIPYLTQHLHNAVSGADTRKIHVYIRALGNVGHKNILEAFEPYLEGNKQASQFQRMLMVLSMDKLVYSNPVVARSILYRIYRNTGEVPEVRVVAVYQLMRTVPPVEMLQRMAQITNIDSQEQVNAAVKSAIEYASQLNSQGSQILRKSAEIAKPLLTKKEYILHQSLNFLEDFIVENMNIEYKTNLLQIGSSDHTLPKGIKYTVRGNINGLKHYFFNVQAMISSIQELKNVWYQQTEEYKNERSKTQSGHYTWSSAQIAEILKLQTNEREQLEGFVYSEIESLQRIWSFDNKTIEQLPQVVSSAEQMLRSGKTFSYVKLKHLREMVLSFPTEMGIPFLYTYDMPLLVQFAGTVKAKANTEISKNNKLRMPKNLFGEIDATVTVGTKIQSHLCVVTPFDHQIYISGINQNVQAHFPLIGKADIDLEDPTVRVKVELQVKETHKDARLLHYSSWPYTSRSDIMNFDPVALRPYTRRIRPEDNSHRTFDFTVGKKETGMSFRFWGHHPRQSVSLLQLASLVQKEGIVAVIKRLWDEASLQQTDATIAFIPNQSTTRKVILNLWYQKLYQTTPRNIKQNGFWSRIWYGEQQTVPDSQSEEKFWEKDQLPFQVEINNQKRLEKITKYVGEGIQSARIYFLDASVEFKGDKVYKHIFTLAAAKSNIVPQSRFVTFYRNDVEDPFSFAFQVKGYVPNNNELNVHYSLQTAPSSQYDAFLQYGRSEVQSSKINGTVNLNRSMARRQYLEERPLYRVCKEQMKEGNRQLSACQNITIESSFLDDIKIELQYENIEQEVSSFIDNMFKGVRTWYYPKTNISNIRPVDENKVYLSIQFHPEHLRQLNLTVKAADEETLIYNLTVCKDAKFICAPHPMMDLQATLLGTIQEYVKPTCIVDSKSAQTFRNLTYPLALDSEWTVMMLYIPQEAQQEQTRQLPVQQLQRQKENFAILVRDLAPYQREIKIIFNNPDTVGKTVDLTLKPKKGLKPAAYILVDNEEVVINENQSARLFDDYVEIYVLPNGEVKIEIRDWFYIIFDGTRAKLVATSYKLRDSIVGLCGRFSEDQYEDFWTPDNCIVRSAEKFVKSFSLRSGQQTQAQQEHEECIARVLPLYADVISDQDIERIEQSSTTKLKSLYFEDNENVCFTMYPVPVCKVSVHKSTSKEIPVHCVSDGKIADDWKKQIERGDIPNFSQLSPTKSMQLEIPQQCD